jgi:hypothetical protein
MKLLLAAGLWLGNTANYKQPSAVVMLNEVYVKNIFSAFKIKWKII